MEKKQTSIIFTGDIGFDRYMDQKWKDPELLSEDILSFFNSADHVTAGVEGPLYDTADNGSHGVFFHSMHPDVTAFLRKINADIWSIGNNHTMDAGAEGLQSTRMLAKENGCMTLGAGMNEIEASEPVYLDEAGGIGMFGVAYMSECIPATATEPGIFRWNDMELIAKRIAEVKSRCRWCVVIAHGGEEFSAMPNPYTRDRYLKYLELGADAVVASHPHVPENFELFDDGKAIFYSLGNFIFDTNYQRAHRFSDGGILLKLIFTEDKLDFEAMGLKIVRSEGRIVSSDLPAIFTNIPAEEYQLLAPLNAKAFLEDNRRTMIYLEPDKYTTASEEVWNEYFYGPDTDGYFKDEHMDLSLIAPLADQADQGYHEKSNLPQVVDYLHQQMMPV